MDRLHVDSLLSHAQLYSVSPINVSVSLHRDGVRHASWRCMNLMDYLFTYTIFASRKAGNAINAALKEILTWVLVCEAGSINHQVLPGIFVMIISMRNVNLPTVHTGRQANSVNGS